MANARRDGNFKPTLLGVSSVDFETPTTIAVNPATGAMLIDLTGGGGTGTVTSVSVVSANGFAGTVATATTTPAITLTTTVTGILSGNGTAILAATTTGTGDVVLATSPTLITPVIGAATGTSLTTSGALRSNTALIVEETGAGTDTITIQAPASIAASYTLTLPTTDGNNLEFLQTDGSGVLTWAAGGSSGANTALSNLAAVAINTTLLPGTDDGAALGDATHNFSDLFLASGAVINFANSNVVLTHTSGILTMGTGELRITTPGTNAASVVTVGASQSLVSKTYNGLTITTTTGTLTMTNAKTLAVTNSLTLSGTDSTVMTFPTTSATIARTDAGNTFTGVSTASAWVLTSPTITTKISPTTDDGAPLGDTTHNFSDLFLASGALINFANSNVVLTQSSGILTMGTGELRITSANVGTNGDSVPTLSSTSTLTNKTLTAPTLGGATSLADGATLKLIVPTVDGTATGPVTSAFVSGYTSSAVGDLVILDSSGKWQKTDANTASIYAGMLGVALAVAATDAALLVALPGSFVYATAFPTMTIGATMYMSETAGAITATQPVTTDAAIRVIGFAVHADKIYFNPSGDWITHV